MLRSRSALVLGCLGALFFAAMAVIGGWSGWGAVFLAIAGLSIVLFVRPHVRVQSDGVVVANPFRQTFVPWSVLAAVRTRWNLELHVVAGRVITSWAIAAQLDRPTFAGSLRIRSDGTRRARSGADAAQAAQLIEQLRVRGIEPSPDQPPAMLSRRWDWLDLALVLLPTGLAVLGFS